MIAPTFMKFAIKQESRLVNKLLQNNNLVIIIRCIMNT